MFDEGRETEFNEPESSNLYYFKKQSSNWSGWGIVDDPNFVTIVKWIKAKEFLEETVARHLKAMRNPMDIQIEESNESKLIQDLNKKFGKIMEPSIQYMHAADCTISKMTVMMASIDMNLVENQNLRTDLMELHELLKIYEKEKHNFIFSSTTTTTK